MISILTSWNLFYWLFFAVMLWYIEYGFDAVQISLVWFMVALVAMLEKNLNIGRIVQTW